LAASGERSLKAQMRQADALGVAYAAIIGERELQGGTVTLRRLADGSQEMVPMTDVAARVRSPDPG
ncbi:MAG: histidine--tRNA ligase, partial [Chloroflexi bacterium]|nr:histidine--tRNA ligase [Chloroflexota bacterium]